MERGFLKLWRRTIDSPVFSDPNLWHMASWCLLRAGHKKRAFRFQAGNQYVVVPLESGQFATGRNSGADELGIKPSTFYKRLKRLSQEPYSFITVTTHSSTLCTIVTICNWQHYQASTIEEEQPKVTSGEQAGNKRVASEEQAGNTNKNEENGKNEEKGSTAPAIAFLNSWHKEVTGADLPHAKRSLWQDAVNRVASTMPLLTVAEQLRSLENGKKVGKAMPNVKYWCDDVMRWKGLADDEWAGITPKHRREIEAMERGL